MNIKHKMFFVLISLIFLSTITLAAPTTLDTTAKASPKVPVAAFTVSPTSGYAPLEVVFTDSNTGTSSSWKWNFGDGNTSFEQSPTHIYYTAGNSTVNLTVNNTNGTNSTFAIITVLQPALLVVNFSSNVTKGYAPLSVQFSGLSENATEWNWDFGDGANSTDKNPVHTYSKDGRYDVTLTVKNVNGTDTVKKYSYINVDTTQIIIRMMEKLAMNVYFILSDSGF